MEISLKMNTDLGRAVSLLNKQRSKHNMKNIVGSCRVKEFSMQKGKTNNFYQVLSLSSEKVGFEEIKRAYRSKALQLHPDVCPSSIKEECTKQFVELRRAYEVLSDPDSRERYDYELSLVDSFGGCGFGGIGRHGRQGGVRGEVLEMQLCGLRKRSRDRMEMEKKKKKDIL